VYSPDINLQTGTIPACELTPETGRSGIAPGGAKRRRETGFVRVVRAAPERCNTAGNKAGCNVADLVQEGSRKSRIGHG